MTFDETWDTRRKWAVQEARDMTEFACHPAAVLSDGSYSVFAKFSDAGNGIEQFEIELAGLKLLAERAGVLIPSPLGIIRVPGGSILVLETVQAVERTHRHWRQIGNALARIHKIREAELRDCFGETHIPDPSSPCRYSLPPPPVGQSVDFDLVFVRTVPKRRTLCRALPRRPAPQACRVGWRSTRQLWSSALSRAGWCGTMRSRSLNVLYGCETDLMGRPRFTGIARVAFRWHV